MNQNTPDQVVIIDHEDPGPLKSRRPYLLLITVRYRARRCTRRNRQQTRVSGKNQFEARAFADLTPDRDVSAMLPDDFRAECQTEAGANVPRLRSEKRLENPPLPFARHSGACVFDGHEHLVALVPRAHRDSIQLHRAFFDRLRGVDQEVENHLSQLSPMGRNRGNVAEVQHQLSAVRYLHARHLARAHHDVIDLNPLGVVSPDPRKTLELACDVANSLHAAEIVLQHGTQLGEHVVDPFIGQQGVDYFLSVRVEERGRLSQRLEYSLELLRILLHREEVGDQIGGRVVDFVSDSGGQLAEGRQAVGPIDRSLGVLETLALDRILHDSQQPFLAFHAVVLGPLT